MFAYVKNYRAWHPAEAVRGMLLYPVVEEAFAIEYPLEETSISIRSIDLRLPWREIEREMKALVVRAGMRVGVG